MDTKDQPISVQKIAELAGTSIATVSRIINQNGRYSKETEARVRAIMEEYRYQPNRLARSLRMQRSQIIGILVPDVSNQFFSGIIKEIQNDLFKRKYLTMICNTNESPAEEEQQVRMLLGQQVDGIIYIGGSGGASYIDIPVVYIDRDPYCLSGEQKKDYAFIESDNVQGGYLAGRELLDGHVKTPAVICFGKQLSTIQGRVEGFRNALEERGLCLRDDLYLESRGDTLSAGANAAAALMEAHPEVDGIFFTSDMMAIGALTHLRHTGFRIPQDLHIIGFDGIEMGNVISPALTSVKQDIRQIGKLAAKHILQLVNRKETASRTVRVPVSLIRRETS